MFKSINYKWSSKYNYAVLFFVILALLNLRIIIRNEMINSRVFSILITNLSCFFVSLLFLIGRRIKRFYQIVFAKKDGIEIRNEFSGYKIIGVKILGGCLELFILISIVIAVIAIQLQLINAGFFEQSLSILRLSGVNPSREVPVALITLFFSYCLLLETIYLSIVIVKTVFKKFKYKKILSLVFFHVIFFINLFVISEMLKGSVDYNFVTVNIIIIKTVLLIFLWYMLTSYLLGENTFSK